jgi:hypothetical protein
VNAEQNGEIQLHKRGLHTDAILFKGLFVSGLVVASVTLASLPAHADPADKSETSKVITYAIADPDLVKHPDKVSGELQRAGNLDRLGVRPATGDKLSEITGKPRVAAAPATYVVDSSRFPKGEKPDNPYQYADLSECLAHTDQASQDAGWIKNRYSYCQTHLISAVSVLCILGRCRVTGIFVSSNTLIGMGKIGADDGTVGDRWTDFQLNIQVLSATGPFNTGSARMAAEIQCAGHYTDGGPDEDPDACSGGENKKVRKSIAAWVVDPNAHLDLVSRGRQPDAAAGEQLATGVFHIDYDFDLPFPYIFGADADGPEGGMRFDSAWYLTTNKAEQLGSVFDRAMPGFSYSLRDAEVRGVADHLLQAQADPANTVPLQPKKVLAGADADNPLRRLAAAKGQYQAERNAENTRVVRNFCRTAEMPAQPPTGGTYDCDEYPMRSTYEGAGRSAPQYDGAAYDRFYSVRWVNSVQNQEAGSRLGRWYANDRLIDADRFYVPIVF